VDGKKYYDSCLRILPWIKGIVIQRFSYDKTSTNIDIDFSCFHNDQLGVLMICKLNILVSIKYYPWIQVQRLLKQLWKYVENGVSKRYSWKSSSNYCLWK
jgi:hypothetical protein